MKSLMEFTNKMKKVNYKELIDIVEGKVKDISETGCLKLGLCLRIEIENKDINSPVRVLKYNHSQAPLLCCGDNIRAHYLKAKEIVVKREGTMTISSYFIRREPKEEELAEKIEVLIDNGVAVYGSINEERVVIEKD